MCLPCGEEVQVISKPFRAAEKSVWKYRKSSLDLGKMGLGSVFPQYLPIRGSVDVLPFLTLNTNREHDCTTDL